MSSVPAPPLDDRPSLVVLTGPTASGKSRLALRLAEALPVTIINADASQLYGDLAILTARPDPAALKAVPHALYGVLDGADPADAARWCGLARDAIAAARTAGTIPLLVGGTGLYLSRLIDGIAPIPAIDSDLRAAVRALPVADAHRALSTEDPLAAATLHATDTTRVARALEVVRQTGRSIRWWQARTSGGIGGAVRLHALVLDPDRALLRERAAARAKRMLDEGAIDEVAALMTRGLDPALPVMRAIGVAPIAAYLEGRIDRPTATDAIVTATHQYIKRQATWARGRARDWCRIPQAGDDAACAPVIADLARRLSAG